MSTATLTPIVSQTATPSPTPVVLLGDTNVEASVGGLLAGTAKAYPYVASSSGTLGHMSVYVDETNAAPRVEVGLYADSGTGHPGSLLATRYVNDLVAGQWNTLWFGPVDIVAGQRYWIALLNNRQGLRIRETANGALAELSQQTTLAFLPSTWTTGSIIPRGPASIYGSPGGFIPPP
jgi:hypothetical protein